LLEWTVLDFAKPYIAVFETREERDRGNGKSTHLE
jgi:hypothetical protein